MHTFTTSTWPFRNSSLTLSTYLWVRCVNQPVVSSKCYSTSRSGRNQTSSNLIKPHWFAFPGANIQAHSLFCIDFWSCYRFISLQGVTNHFYTCVARQCHGDIIGASRMFLPHSRYVGHSSKPSNFCKTYLHLPNLVHDKNLPIS